MNTTTILLAAIAFAVSIEAVLCVFVLSNSKRHQDAVLSLWEKSDRRQEARETKNGEQRVTMLLSDDERRKIAAIVIKDIAGLEVRR